MQPSITEKQPAGGWSLWEKRGAAVGVVWARCLAAGSRMALLNAVLAKEVPTGVRYRRKDEGLFSPLSTRRILKGWCVRGWLVCLNKCIRSDNRSVSKDDRDGISIRPMSEEKTSRRQVLKAPCDAKQYVSGMAPSSYYVENATLDIEEC